MKKIILLTLCIVCILLLILSTNAISVYAQGGTASKYGFPLGNQYFNEETGQDCQDFEGGTICVERCEFGEVWENDKCINKEDVACQVKGMINFSNK